MLNRKRLFATGMSVTVPDNPKNSLPITQQENRLNFYQENRNEPVPPPSVIISNVKHIPARPPSDAPIRGTCVPSGKGLPKAETKPKAWWQARTTESPKDILSHKWIPPEHEQGSTSNNKFPGRQNDAPRPPSDFEDECESVNYLEEIDADPLGMAHKIAYSHRYQ